MKSITVSTTGEQDVRTPQNIMTRIQPIWPCDFDLAASKENSQFPKFFTKEDDALKQDWSKIPHYTNRYLWLNPPFKQTSKFMEKCVKESKNGVKICSLTLASRGSVWYRKFVRPNALSLILENRITFDGHEYVYPKELQLNIFGCGITGEGYWNWKSAEPMIKIEKRTR